MFLDHFDVIYTPTSKTWYKEFTLPADDYEYLRLVRVMLRAPEHDVRLCKRTFSLRVLSIKFGYGCKARVSKQNTAGARGKWVGSGLSPATPLLCTISHVIHPKKQVQQHKACLYSPKTRTSLRRINK